jgi:hypothetical protein
MSHDIQHTRRVAPSFVVVMTVAIYPRSEAFIEAEMLNEAVKPRKH